MKQREIHAILGHDRDDEPIIDFMICCKILNGCHRRKCDDLNGVVSCTNVGLDDRASLAG